MPTDCCKFQLHNCYITVCKTIVNNIHANSGKWPDAVPDPVFLSFVGVMVKLHQVEDSWPWESWHAGGVKCMDEQESVNGDKIGTSVPGSSWKGVRLPFTIVLQQRQWKNALMTALLGRLRVDLIKPASMTVCTPCRSMSDARRYAIWPNPRSRSRSRGVESYKFFHFQNQVLSAIFIGSW